MTKVTKPGPGFDPTPSTERITKIAVRVEDSVPADAKAVGILVPVDGPVPEELSLERPALIASGFEGKPGQALLIPRPAAPSLVAIGIGDASKLDGAALRDAAAAFARAACKHTHLAMKLGDAARIEPRIAGQAVIEGILLARYHYDVLKHDVPDVDLAEVLLVAAPGPSDDLAKGAQRGRVFAAAAAFARDLANTPPAHLTATRIAEIAAAIAANRGLDVEIYDRDALFALGCGGLLAVNAGSIEPPRMVKLTYRPPEAAETPHLVLVGKGVTYDSGGISLKPSDNAHATMKVDMSGAGAVLAAMSALPLLGCPTRVTSYLMCTDNMPSGSAMKMGDVLTIHGGKTVEIFNTDAEGRLALADALDLALADDPNAIVDIATLTGSCLRALGGEIAGLFGNQQTLVAQLMASAKRTGEPVWQLPLDQRYRKYLESTIADMKNIGGENAGAIVAALFLAEFVGDVPWAHLDIAGTAHRDTDEAWRRRGGTGYGARLLIDLALNFSKP